MKYGVGFLFIRFLSENVFILCIVGIIMDFEKLLIVSGKYWDAKIHHSQSCIGKCLLWYKGDEGRDFLELNEEERREFWIMAKRLKVILDKLFSPDKYNYLCAGNRTPHLHFHIIPRYRGKREFNGEVFEDVDFGGFPHSEKKVSEEVLFGIRDAIRKEL